MQEHLVVVDGSGFIYRSYHALPPLTRRSDGMPIHAVSGFCNGIWGLLNGKLRFAKIVQPTHFAVVFDYSRKTFRHDIYPEYKSDRGEVPEDLSVQMKHTRRAVKALGFPAIEEEGFEADDIIATMAHNFEQKGGMVTIASSDKDLAQLVTPSTILYDPMTEKKMGSAEVVEKFGVTPDKMVDLQTLTGDKVDNVPGIPGIGNKTAAELIERFGTAEEVLRRADEITQPKRREAIKKFGSSIRLSRMLVQLSYEAEVPYEWDDMSMKNMSPRGFIEFLDEMGLSTLIKKVEQVSL